MAVKKLPVNRQARRKERTKRLLTDAATKLLLEKGVDALTVQDITEQADVARGTFYVYFESKEEVVWAVLEAILSDIDDYLKTKPARQDDARYAKWQYVFKQIAENQELLLALIGEKGHISTLRRMEAFIAQLMTRDLEAGRLTPKHSLPIDFVTQYLAGALTRIIIDWLEQPQKTSIDELASRFFTMARQQFEADQL